MLKQEAELFIRRCFYEIGKTEEAAERRVQQIHDEIHRNGSYNHSYEELAHGAKMAWRNSNRCIGRLFWNRLHVFDARELDSEDAIFEALLRHIEFAVNGGEIRPAITIFKQAVGGLVPVRIWNHQLLRYAGYEIANGHVIGDSSSISFTKVCESLGWRGEGTPYDLLPLVIQLNRRKPRIYDLPKEIVLEVQIHHPEFDLLHGKEVKWYAVPIISDMLLEIGGIRYVAAPFNGWYMGTEIGARNLADESRYNLLPDIAEAMGLDRTSNTSLWKDRALVELNVAVLHSFRENGVSIVDHHTAAQQFGVFQKNEDKAGREVTGRWSWLIPPLSPATTDLFHSTFKDDIVSPSYLYQKAPYA